MNLSSKLILTSLFGGSSLVALLLFKSFTQNYFTERNNIELNFKTIATAHQQLDYQILNNAFFLYANQDSINHGIEDVNDAITSLATNPHVLQHHPKMCALLQKHQEKFEQKIELIYDFQTDNSVIKNTTAALLVSQHYLFKQTQETHNRDNEVLASMNEIVGSILVAKNGLDSALILSLHPKIEQLSLYHFQNPKNEELSQRIISHFKVIEKFFPRYIQTIEQIKDPALLASLQEAKVAYFQESEQELHFIAYFSYVLVALFIISIGIIAFFLFQSERDARLDPLTRLRNRKAYEEDLKQKWIKPALILININKFKHYNDFYGMKEGDRLLIATADRIRTMQFLGRNPSYYRLGADDFGILFDLAGDNALTHIAKKLLDTFGTIPILIDEENRTPSISVSASDIYPFLETADMALKNKTYSNLIIYHQGLNLQQIIAENMTKAQELKEALHEGRVVPFYHPIVNLSTNKVTKHEVLGRIIINGEIRSIFPYLLIAKESKLYPDLTRSILTQSFTTIAESRGDFSVNLSIDDISNVETVQLIENLLQKYESIGKRIIFEILESEAIEEYNEIVDFIVSMRHYGCRIAIDDFGSGYSNFARILNLSIDIIKIDGSLIRYLDTDDKAITIVQTIVNFTKNSSIKTVAEFVHNEAVARIVKELEIDDAQGFYFYEPAAHPVNL